MEPRQSTLLRLLAIATRPMVQLWFLPRAVARLEASFVPNVTASACQACGHRGITGQITCPICSGQRFVDDLPCRNCDGYGVMKTEDTRSRHTFYDIARPLGDGKGRIAPPIDVEAEVLAHVQRVAELHAARHRAKSFKLDGMMKPKGGTKS
jgi:hypothetical protein